MFDAQYHDWNQKRIKAIVDFYGHQFFFSKKMLDLGCGYADISGVFYRLGSTVTAVDSRQEHLKIVSKKYSGIQVIQSDLDRGWPFYGKDFDIILDLGLLCHLSEYETHLKSVCASTSFLVLETAVLDSNDPKACISVLDSKNVYDGSANGNSLRVSPAAIERVLLESGMSFKKITSNKLNSGNYKYDWMPNNDGSFDIYKRCLWFCIKEKHVPFNIKAPINNSFSVLKDSKIPIIRQQNVLPSLQDQINIQNIQNSSLPTLSNPRSLNNEIPDIATVKFIPRLIESKKTRTAVCISGHLRTFEKTGPSIVNNIINRTGADVFIHTWDTLGFDLGRGDAHSISLKTEDYLDKINEMFSPKEIVVEQFFQQDKSKYIDRIAETRDPANVLGMFYKIKKCNELKQNYEEKNNFLYDVIIRCRADLNVDTPLNTDDFSNLNNIFLPEFDFYLGNNDKFAFGTSKIMDLYSLCFDYIPLYYDKGCIFNAEAIMKYHLNYFHMPVKRCNIKYTIHRIDGFKFSNT